MLPSSLASSFLAHPPVPHLAVTPFTPQGFGRCVALLGETIGSLHRQIEVQMRRSDKAAWATVLGEIGERVKAIKAELGPLRQAALDVTARYALHGRAARPHTPLHTASTRSAHTCAARPPTIALYHAARFPSTHPVHSPMPLTHHIRAPTIALTHHIPLTRHMPPRTACRASTAPRARYSP